MDSTMKAIKEASELRINQTWDPEAEVYEVQKSTGGSAHVRLTENPSVRIIEVPSIEARSFKGVVTDVAPEGLTDSTIDIEAALWANKTIQIVIGGKKYIRKITASEGSLITFPALIPEVPEVPEVPAVSATAVIGEAGGGQVTVTRDTAGVYDGSVEYVAGVGESVTLEATFADDMITVTLATDENGDLDNEENTGTAVAAAIDTLEGFSATMTGAGGAVAQTAEPVPFDGGSDLVPAVPAVPAVTAPEGALYEVFI